MKRLMIAAAAMLAVPAQAHIVFAPAEAPAGSYYAGEFRVGHGCGDAATTAVRVVNACEGQGVNGFWKRSGTCRGLVRGTWVLIGLVL